MEKGYIGKIKNSGAQVVKAPYKTAKKAKAKAIKGNDLRNGR